MDENNTSNANKTKPAGQGNMNAALAYLLGWITGIILLLTEKNDDFIRFHAAQSLIVFGALSILSFVPLVNLFVWMASIILWIVLMYKAYSGERFALPFVGDFAEQLKNQIK